MQYQPQKIERLWQRKWSRGHPKPKGKKGKKGKYYILDMFPYPSGDGLHVGHVENFTATDIYARFKRFQGYEVIHPMGWDAFGLPAENFAIKTGIHPDKKTRQCIKNFTRQINAIGLSYDWEREINTSSSEYYRWTQWMFLLLYKNGLAYKKKAKVNWCASCQTVLANEQVVDGKCFRSGDVVVQKELEQWFFKITDFVEDTKTKEGKKVKGLLSGLKKLDWPSSTKMAQANWIGRSEGAEVVFYVADSEEEIRVFTTRLDTIYGCTYVVVAPEHPIINNQESKIKNWEEVEKYLAVTKKKTDLERTELNKEKTGICLEGVEAIHPFTGKRLQVYVADYVLGTYGTGAVMGVPAHDDRDAEFAKRYDLEVIQSIRPRENAQENLIQTYTEDGVVIDSQHFSGLTSADAREKMTTWLKKEKLGRKVVNYRLRDWLISRQRYWGAPIPIIYCHECGLRELKPKLNINFRRQDVWDSIVNGHKTIESRVLNPDEPHRYFGDVKTGDVITMTNKITNEIRALSVMKVNKFQSVADLFKHKDLLKAIHPSHTYKSLDELESAYTETAPGYLDRIHQNGLVAWEISLLNAEKAYPVPMKELPVKLPTDVDFRPTGESPLVRSKSFHKVKCPKCGAKARRESDTMDTFVCSSWYYLRFADPQNQKAFASKKNLEKNLPVDFYMGGAEHTVLHLLYARFFTKMLAKSGYVNFDEPFTKLRHQGIILGEDGNKMSKSKGNVVNPDQVIEEFGADSLRLYEMFMGPLEEMKPWKTSSIVGLRRFLERVWKLQEKTGKQLSTISNKQIEPLLHKTIKKVTEDIESFKFNTAISSLMILVNALEKEETLSIGAYRSLLILLSPFAPHLTEELWERLGEHQSIFLAEWPKWDKHKIVEETMTIVVQVNGKVRERLAVDARATEKEIQEAALSSVAIAKILSGAMPKKYIFVPGRLINIVV